LSNPTYRVYICCGLNCGPKGSRQLVDFLEDEVRRLALEDRVHVYPGGCQNHCDSGPTMVVYPGPTFYQEVDRARLRRIAVEHFGNGVPVTDFFWHDPIGSPRDVKKPLIDQPAHLPVPVDFFKARQDKSPKPKPKKTYEVDDFKW
jgi:(2Fe-2S) ferredoxin